MERIISLGKDLVTDGYKLVGWTAPTLSILFTVAKWQEWQVVSIDLREVSYAWAFAPLMVWFFIAYARRWEHSRDLEGANQPRINIDWRYSAPKRCELIVTNVSRKTITGIEVIFRNYRRADGTDVTDMLKTLTSVDGKETPITLNPNVPTYFCFAELKMAKINEPRISILSGTDDERQFSAEEIGVKLSISGHDLPGHQIDFRLRRVGDNTISMEPWEMNQPAVGIEGS